jgi:mono/diheme cytochrome c family protein
MLRAGVLILLLAVSWMVAAEPRSVRDGVYTKAQSVRGEKIYREQCARCHGENLAGGDEAPELAGAEFRERWKGKIILNLCDEIRKRMPSDGPGVLSRQESADLAAYLLSENEFPAGQKELPIDDAALQEIRIELKESGK